MRCCQSWGDQFVVGAFAVKHDDKTVQQGIAVEFFWCEQDVQGAVEALGQTQVFV